MDKLDKVYYWHLITLAKMKLLRRECERKCLEETELTID